jgi:hypothetical protein
MHYSSYRLHNAVLLRLFILYTYYLLDKLFSNTILSDDDKLTITSQKSQWSSRIRTIIRCTHRISGSMSFDQDAEFIARSWDESGKSFNFKDVSACCLEYPTYYVL